MSFLFEVLIKYLIMPTLEAVHTNNACMLQYILLRILHEIAMDLMGLGLRLHHVREYSS